MGECVESGVNSINYFLDVRNTSNYFCMHDPLDFEMDFDDIIKLYSIDKRDVIELLDCSSPVRLDGSSNSELRPFHRQTASLDDFKSLIGIPDRFIQSNKATPPAPLNVAFSEKFSDPEHSLSPDEFNDVLRAAGNYLFGSSSAIAQFKQAIEMRLAPFNLSVYAARKIRIRPTGILTISGPPSVIIAEEIEIDSGGGLQIETVTRILSDRMLKVVSN